MVLPGSTLGILGSGQLGRMTALAARQLGYRVLIFSPEKHTPAGQTADQEICASYQDEKALEKFGRQVQVVTVEFENIPASALEYLSRFTSVRPGANVLHIAQHRLREKTFLHERHFPVPPFRPVSTPAELAQAAKDLGLPLVIKTADSGYDGKGQKLLNTSQEVQGLNLGGRPHIVESFVDFACELSVIVARGVNGALVPFGVFENRHAHHILDVTLSPPRTVGPAQASQAQDIACQIAKELDVVGLLCVEFFLTKKGQILINELAPRPHNSGHLTLDAAISSQFEQLVRAICGLPLGSPELLAASAMANLLGDLWTEGPPSWARALAIPEIKLHLYGKSDPRPGRKMGHLTSLGATIEEAEARVLNARRALERPAL